MNRRKSEQGSWSSASEPAGSEPRRGRRLPRGSAAPDANERNQARPLATTSSSETSSQQKMRSDDRVRIRKKPEHGKPRRSRMRATCPSLVDQHPAKGVVTREEKDRIVEADDHPTQSTKDVRIKTDDIQGVSGQVGTSEFNLREKRMNSSSAQNAAQVTSMSQSSKNARKALANRKRALVKLFRSNPKTVQNTIVNIEIFLKDSRKVKLHRSPRHHWAMEVCCLTMFEVYLKLKKRSVTFEHTRENLENLYALVEFLDVETPSAAQYLARQTRRCMHLLADLSSKLEHYAGLKATKWTEVAETLSPWIDRVDMETPPHEIVPNLEDFTVARILGAGGFGAVYKARFGDPHPKRGIYCTVKLVPRSMFEVAKHACVDKVVGSCVRHPFIGKYFNTFLSNQAYVTVMEYIRGVDLRRAIKQQKGLKEEQLRLIIAQLGLALNHMHLKGFIHRDIKPSNMMVMPGCGVKLIDYDTIKIGIGCYTKRTLSTYRARSYCEFNDRESAGTLSYHSPELCKVQYYGRSLDWWAVGVTAYQCFFGKLPFRGEKDDDDLKRMIIACEYPLEINDYRPSPALREFITQLMMKRASARLCSKSFGEFLDHDLFKDLSWSQVERGRLSLPCEGIDSLCYVQHHGAFSPIPPEKDFSQTYLKLSDQKGESQQVALYTYISPGFRTLLQKHRKKLPISEKDLEDPPEPQPKTISRRYRFGDHLYQPRTRKSHRAP